MDWDRRNSDNESYDTPHAFLGMIFVASFKSTRLTAIRFNQRSIGKININDKSLMEMVMVVLAVKFDRDR